MIVTNLENLAQQILANAKFERALAFLRHEGWREYPEGGIGIDGKNVYGMLQSYETKVPQDNVPFEGHRKYIDVQYMIEGKETIYWTQTSGLTPTTPYDDANDIWFSNAPRDDATTVMLTARQLAVFFPSDAHAPMHSADKPTRVRKIVVKVAV